MADLATLLGYDMVAADIAHALHESDNIGLLEGPPGVGKSWLAEDIGQLWEAGGGSAVLAEGDALRSDVSFYPFGLVLSGLPRRWRSASPAVASFAKAGEALVGTAGLITTTVQMLAKIQQAQQTSPHHPAALLGSLEQDALHKLDRLGRKRPILLIADNLHWWDSRSLEFLGTLLDHRMRSAFPSLGTFRVLAVQTTEHYQPVANPKAHSALLNVGRARRFELCRPPREGFEDVLVALGADPKPSREVTDAVYSMSGGHLALASRCVERLTAGESEDFLTATDSEEFLQQVLTDRIQALGAFGNQVIELLQVAAMLGLTFSREEVVCAYGADESDVAKLLRHCRDEDVLELSEGIGKFIHDLYRHYFLNVNARDKTEIHERLSDCLRLLRPGEYELRCVNAIDAERAGEAAALGVQAALQEMREGRSGWDLPPTILYAIKDGGVADVVTLMEEALRHLNGYRFDDCLASLDRLPRDLRKCLLAEADYLRAMCLMSTRSEDYRAKGRSLLEAWSGYEEEEPELGTRLMLLLLYGVVHLSEKEEAWALEGRIRQALINRASFDTSAKDALYTLDRSSGSLYPADVALVRNREAAAYYGPDPDGAVIRRPVEYYRCLVNLGASLISCGRYDEAREIYMKVERLVNHYYPGTFPRLDYPRTNNILAEYRTAYVNGQQAVKKQRGIVTALSADNDPFFGENALAVYLALTERYEEALEIFDRLAAELTRNREKPEPSVSYLIASNRCATDFVAGNVDIARVEWSKLDDLVRRIAYTSRPVYVRRHELLAEVIQGARDFSATEFDKCLLESHPEEFGPVWESYGRGFMLPAIEFWREN